MTSQVPSILLIAKFSAKKLEGREEVFFNVILNSPNKVSPKQRLLEKYCVSWPPASPEHKDTTTEPMCARLGAHLLSIPSIPADNSSGELWMTLGSHHRLNFSQLVRWKGDAHCIQRTLEPNTRFCAHSDKRAL